MPPEDSGEEFSQDDLDNLFEDVMGGDEAKDAEGEKSADAKPEEAPAAPAEGEGGDVSGDEIDQLLADATDDASQAGAGAEGDVDVSQDEIDNLLGGLIGGDEGGGESAEADSKDFGAFDLEQFAESPDSAEVAKIDLLRDVTLNVKIELGRQKMYIREVLKLVKGSVVELDKLAGDPLDILVNDRLVAKGEVLVLNDNFCVRITEILSPMDRKDQEKE